MAGSLAAEISMDDNLMQHTWRLRVSSGGAPLGSIVTTRASWHPRCGPRPELDIGVAAVIIRGRIEPTAEFAVDIQGNVRRSPRGGTSASLSCAGVPRLEALALLLTRFGPLLFLSTGGGGPCRADTGYSPRLWP